MPPQTLKQTIREIPEASRFLHVFGVLLILVEWGAKGSPVVGPLEQSLLFFFCLFACLRYWAENHAFRMIFSLFLLILANPLFLAPVWADRGATTIVLFLYLVHQLVALSRLGGTGEGP